MIGVMTTSAPTRVEPVRARLRDEVLTGKLAPGAKLRLADLAERLGVSVGVVREALIRLTAEGLVVAEPQLGFRVIPVSAKDLDDLVGARLVVECETFRSAMTHGDHEWEGAVIAAYHRLQRIQEQTDSGRTGEGWVAGHRFFHMTLLSGCPNQRLVAASMSLRDGAELYRTSSVKTMSAADAKRRDAEHLALRDAAVGRDIERGVALLGEHIKLTANYFGPGPDHEASSAPSRRMS